MSALQGIEDPLNDVFVKKAPALPKGFKDFLVTIAPWVTLIAGILSLLSILSIYRWATAANDLVDYANSISQAYGNGTVISHGWSLTLWLSLIVMLVTAILYILAFSPLRQHKKQGWDYLFYAMILNVVYGIVVAASNYGTVANFIWSLIFTAIGAYILFQIRSYYLGKGKATSASAAAAPPPPASKKK